MYALYALLSLQPSSFNVYTDSKYLASLSPDFVTAFLYNLDEELYVLFSKTQALIQSRTEPFFIAHMHAHSGYLAPWQQGMMLLISSWLLSLHLLWTNTLIFIPMLKDCTLNTIFPSLKRDFSLNPVMSALLCTYVPRFQELILMGNSLTPFSNPTSLIAPWEGFICFLSQWIHFQVLYGQCLSLQNPTNTPFPHFYSPSLLWEYLRS